MQLWDGGGGGDGEQFWCCLKGNFCLNKSLGSIFFFCEVGFVFCFVFYFIIVRGYYLNDVRLDIIFFFEDLMLR